ncbi:27 kDa hemolymph protein-like [Arctopsyche grandis]|uniref:27 kDa hemolymph protein-like n=1 Tax=Arctopsyche grandis TaxID=121162 RepID=UPI00406D890F
MKCILGIFILSLASVGLTENTDDINTIKDAIGDVPGLDINALPSAEEAQAVFKQKCIKEANETAYDNAVKAKDDVQKCVQSLINVDELKAEIEEAKPTGDLDVVFKKYCRKSPLLKQCISNFTDAIEPCLTPKERENKKIVLNITESLTNFICYKEGDRIALFIAEGGPECLMDKQDAIQVCINSSMSKYIPTETPSLENLPELLMKSEQCDDMVKMQDCIVRELEGCSEPTPANIAESLFKFIKKVTPCGKESVAAARDGSKSAPNSPSTSSGNTVVKSSMLLAVFAIYFI